MPTGVRFSRGRTSEYDKLLDSTAAGVLDAYKFKKDEEQMWITFETMNLAFQKKPGEF